MTTIALLAMLICSFALHASNRFDLTIVGQIKWAGGLERLPVLLTRLFKNEFAINSIHTSGHYNFDDIPRDEVRILKNPDKTPGTVALLFDILWAGGGSPASFVPEKSFIKIAYSMLEGTAIPQQWVDILNKKFDLVVVPDKYYQNVYSTCGVTIPIFVLPHGIDIQEFLEEPLRTEPSWPFIFGSSSSFIPRKNQSLLIEAFHAEFKNNPSVQLKIHGRDGYIFSEIQKKVKKLHSKNIELIHGPLSRRQYRTMLKSFDCYVLLSKGEGFSVTPREALALGKPCIISDNTAHHTIAQTGCVYAVPSIRAEPAIYEVFPWPVGYNFNCSVHDVRRALRDVYNNYQTYVEKAREGRKWVQKYTWENLKAKFRNLIKPTNVVLGQENKITGEYLMTSDVKLYNKYIVVSQNNKIPLPKG